jgi:hypothetical protein
MNHGIINKNYYAGLKISAIDLYEIYPDLIKYRDYFKNLKKRDRYYSAMKYHTIKVIKKIYPEISLILIADVINVPDHSSVLYYLNSYTPLMDHSSFISLNYNRFIEYKIYPLSVHPNLVNNHGVFKQITLDELKKLESIKKKKKKPNVRKYSPLVKKNPKEKY